MVRISNNVRVFIIACALLFFLAISQRLAFAKTSIPITPDCTIAMADFDITSVADVDRLVRLCPREIASTFIARKAKGVASRRQIAFRKLNGPILYESAGRLSVVERPTWQRLEDLEKSGTLLEGDPDKTGDAERQAQSAANTASTIANISASNAAAIANMAATSPDRTKYCVYRKNALAAVTGLLGLARAVKIKDNLSVLGFLLPIPFSPCDQIAALSTKPVITGPTGAMKIGSEAQITVTEPGYSGGFTLVSSDEKVATLAVDASHTNTWQLTAKAAGPVTITATDTNGNLNALVVNVSS